MMLADEVIVVSGLPRSGTSMMMAMLQAGGVELLTDEIRQADADNPNGYFEYERVKALEAGDGAWLSDARGKAVKVVSALLDRLPPEYVYRVIFMHREMAEVVASQDKMLARRGGAPAADDRMALRLEKHVARVQAWLATRPNVSVINVDYNRMIADPEPQIAAVDRFLGGGLNAEQMAQIVSPQLYRNRAP
jgi:hypothetical protein